MVSFSRTNVLLVPFGEDGQNKLWNVCLPTKVGAIWKPRNKAVHEGIVPNVKTICFKICADIRGTIMSHKVAKKFRKEVKLWMEIGACPDQRQIICGWCDRIQI